jgi:hypothetical protein
MQASCFHPLTRRVLRSSDEKEEQGPMTLVPGDWRKGVGTAPPDGGSWNIHRIEQAAERGDLI